MSVSAQIQGALLHPKRTEILSYLMQKRGGTGASENEIATACAIGAHIVRYHLKVLQSAGLITRFEGEQELDAERSYVAALQR